MQTPVSLQLIWPEAASSRFFKFGFAGSQLVRILFGPVLNLSCHSFQPGLLTVGFSIEPVMSLMIGEIEIKGVITANSTHGIAEIAVPANKINSISEASPVGAPVTRTALVFLPCFVHRLGIAIGRGGSRAWEKTKTSGARWFGFGLKF